MCAGTRKRASINTPLDLAILNQIDRFNLAIDVIDRVPRLHSSGAHVKEWLKGQIIASITTLTLKESTKKKFDVGSGPDKLAFSPRCTTSVWFALQGHWELMFAVAPIAYHLVIYYDRWLRQKSDEAVRDA